MGPPACQAIHTSTADHLIYQPLGPTPRQIRLLRLHPGTKAEDIECHLDYVSLEDNPEFTALSYVWGDLTETHTIRLQGVMFPVTKNLHDALWSIRSRLPRMLNLWVDALCVNQQDLAERSRQVRQMQFIYGQAKHTIIWFGPGDELSRSAVRLMIEMKNTLEPKDEPLFNNLPCMAELTRDIVTTHPMTLLLDQLDGWEALSYMDPILLWGEDALEWIICQEAMIMTTFWFALANFYGLRGYLQLRNGIAKAAAVTRLCQRRLDEGPKRGLLHLVESFCANEATDPRDKVYALLGLADDEYSESIVPNYESSVSLVYAEAVRDIITREGNLQVLSYSSVSGGHGESAIPSWAPDWRSTAYKLNGPPEHRSTPFYQIDRVLRKNYPTAKPENFFFRAAHDTPPAVGFCKQMKRLYAVGIRVDVIGRISKTRSYDYSLEEIKDEWGTLCGWNDRTNVYLPTGQPRIDACIETLSAGQFTPRSNPREVLESFAAVTGGRKFFVGEAGYQGLASPFAQVGDVIAVLLGSPHPLMLREVEDHYVMLGETYVHGIMYGEMITRLEKGWVELEEFEIW